MADLQQLEDSIVGLSLLDAAQLVKKLEARLGVSAAAAAPVRPRMKEAARRDAARRDAADSEAAPPMPLGSNFPHLPTCVHLPGLWLGRLCGRIAFPGSSQIGRNSHCRGISFFWGSQGSLLPRLRPFASLGGPDGRRG